MISSNKLPAGWQIKSIGSFSKVTTGATPLRAKHDRYFTGGTIPWIKTTDLNNSDIVDCEEKITELAVKENSCSVLPKDTVLVAMYGGFRQIGRTGILRIPAATNQALSAIRVDKKEAMPYFLLHYLNENVSQWKRLAASSRKDPNITRQDVLDYEVVLPPLEQQEKIVAVATTWDEAIALQNRQLQQLRRRKKEVAFRLLIKQERINGFNEDWEKYQLGDYFDRLTTRNALGNTNVLTISAQQGLVSQTKYFNKSIASEEVSNYFLLSRGDFAYNKSYSAGYPMGVIKPLTEYDHGIVSPLYICLRPTTEDAEFFEHYFEAGMLNQGISRIAQEGARNHGLLNVSSRDFMELDTIVPPAAERRAIADMLNTADAEIRLNERKLEALREQKSGLLYKLLTGEILLS
ncbi:MAG: restriction endonuclease subunit S [Janthinobacterium lividum]